MRKISIICLFLTVSLFLTGKSYGWMQMDTNTYVITYSCGSGTGVPPASHETYLASGSSGSGPTTPNTATLNPANNTCTPPNGQIFAGWLIDGSTAVTTPVQPGVEIQWSEGHDGLLIAQYQNDPSDLNTNNPTCVYGTLHTYTGPVDIEANFVPNTINTTWYSDGTQLTGNNIPATCTYDDTLTPPTPAARPGYVFGGWRLKVPACEIPSSLVGGGSSYGYKNDSTGEYGEDSYDTSEYGLTEDNTWGLSWSNGDKVVGEAKCSALEGDRHDWEWGGNSADWSASESELTNASGEAQYCWCRATGYIASGSSQCSLSSSSWVFIYAGGSASECAYFCANWCGNYLVLNLGFNRALFTGLVAE